MKWPVRLIRMLVTVERLPAAAPEPTPEGPGRRGLWSVLAIEPLDRAPQPRGERANRRSFWSSMFGLEPLDRAPEPARAAERPGALSMLLSIEKLPREPEEAARPALPILRWLLKPERLGEDAETEHERR